MLVLLLTSTHNQCRVVSCVCMIDSCLTAKKKKAWFQIGTCTVNCIISSVISCLTAKKKWPNNLSHHQLPDMNTMTVQVDCLPGQEWVALLDSDCDLDSSLLLEKVYIGIKRCNA